VFPVPKSIILKNPNFMSLLPNKYDLLKAIALIQKNGRDYVITHHDRNKLAQDMLDIIITVTQKRSYI
jgi:hypothetical protein